MNGISVRFQEGENFYIPPDEKGNLSVAVGGSSGAKGDGAKRPVIGSTRDLIGMRIKDA